MGCLTARLVLAKRKAGASFVRLDGSVWTTDKDGIVLALLAAELGIQPEVCHLNEGHAAFAILERARAFMNETAQPFEVALAVDVWSTFNSTHSVKSLVTSIPMIDPMKNSWVMRAATASLILPCACGG